MFRLFKRDPPKEPAHAQLAPAETYSDNRLVSVIRSTLEASPAIVGCFFLVAYENADVICGVFSRVAKEEGSYPATVEGFVRFLADEHAKRKSASTEDAINRRRYFYLYSSTLLKVAHGRAKQHPELWDQIADIWIALMKSARHLRNTLDTTGLWTSSETEFFANVKTEQDGERYCLMVAPPEIRYHKKLADWLDG